MGSDENYRNLAIAVIRQAASDWTKAARTLRKNPGSIGARRIKLDTEAFFRSDWCLELGGVDGRYILRKLQEELEG